MSSGALSASVARYWPRTVPVATISEPGAGRLTPGCRTTSPVMANPVCRIAAHVAGSQPMMVPAPTCAVIQAAAAFAFACAAACPACRAAICCGVSRGRAGARAWRGAGAGWAVRVRPAAMPAPATTTTTAATPARRRTRTVPTRPESGTCSTRRRSHNRTVVPMTVIHDGSDGCCRRGAPPAGPPLVAAGLSSRYPDGGEVSLDTAEPPGRERVRPHGPIRDSPAHPARR